MCWHVTYYIQYIYCCYIAYSPAIDGLTVLVSNFSNDLLCFAVRVMQYYYAYVRDEWVLGWVGLEARTYVLQ